ncbi:MAG: hypothetical protein WC656_03305 [Sulfurimonas sp.]|jgi:hypothetical protein
MIALLSECCCSFSTAGYRFVESGVQEWVYAYPSGNCAIFNDEPNYLITQFQDSVVTTECFDTFDEAVAACITFVDSRAGGFSSFEIIGLHDKTIYRGATAFHFSNYSFNESHPFDHMVLLQYDYYRKN